MKTYKCTYGWDHGFNEGEYTSGKTFGAFKKVKIIEIINSRSFKYRTLYWHERLWLKIKVLWERE